MKNEDYFSNAFFSLKSIKKNLVLFLPDLLYFVIWGLLTILFFHFNNLNSIFSGQLSNFANDVKGIVTTKPLFLRLIISFLVVVLLNIIVVISVIATRFIMIKKIIKNEKIKLLEVYKEGEKHLLSLISLKFIIILIYAVPIIFLMGLGFIYKPFLLIMLIASVLVFILIKFFFTFVYSVMFLDSIKNPFRIIKLNAEYLDKNLNHVVIVFLFAVIIGALIGGFFTLLPIGYGLLGYSAIYLSIIILIVKTFIDIGINLWTTLFIFKSY